AQALAEKKDAAALVALCQQETGRQRIEVSSDGMRDLVPCAAAEALSELGGTEVDAIKTALSKNPGETGWLIYALGRSSAPSALEVLKELAERERGEWSFRKANIAYALALKGEPGKKALQRLAKQMSGMGSAAAWWLERKAEPAWPAPTWP